VDTEDVWSLIERARREVPDTSDADAVAARTVELLAQYTPAQIAAFDRSLEGLLAESYRADLWAAAYLINGDAFHDGFLFFRGWLIAQGREAFERTLADADSLAERTDVAAAGCECEDMVNVAFDACRVLGVEFPADNVVVDPEMEGLWDLGDEQQMRAHLPRLAAMCYGALEGGD
jgi:hypothetical protein